MPTKHPGRGGSAWERARKEVLATYDTCCFCGREVDKTAPPRSSMGPSVEHTVSLKSMRGLDPETQKRLSLDVRYLRLAHYGCNSRAGARNRVGPSSPTAISGFQHKRVWSRVWYSPIPPDTVVVGSPEFAAYLAEKAAAGVH